MEARLIDAERLAAFARLAQAIAHEIRNPVMIAGGLLKRVKIQEDRTNAEKLSAVMEALDGIASVLKEVDSFVTLQAPRPKIEDMGLTMQECLNKMGPDMKKKGA